MSERPYRKIAREPDEWEKSPSWGGGWLEGERGVGPKGGGVSDLSTLSGR